MTGEYVSIDFEYNDTQEERVNLVCCVLQVEGEDKEEFWLNDSLPNGDSHPCWLVLFDRLVELSSQGYIFLSYNVSAEASAFLSLNLPPEDFKWIDLYVEFRCLANHNDSIKYGKHLIDGEVKTLKKPRPKWAQNEGDKKSGGTLTFSLSQAVYKFLGVKIDTKHKEEMRQLIISKPEKYTFDEKDSIVSYCGDDVRYLLPLFKKMSGVYRELLPKKELSTLKQEMIYRGECMARTARIERLGYPINYKNVKNFSSQASSVLCDIQRDINEQFPEIRPFWFDRKSFSFITKRQPQIEWVKSQGLSENWLKTDKKELSLSLDAWAEHFDFKHDYPRGNFGAQMLRYLKTKQAISAFIPSKTGDRKKFWDYVGSDKIVRPYLNPYGAQSSRFQPAATGFLFLKPAWMRSLCEPPKGKMIVGIDYSQEEFLIAALMSGDKKMERDYYAPGGPYLNFGKSCGVIPKDGDKHTHPVMRQACKSSILGQMFGMTEIGLSKKLTVDVGRPYTEEEAKEWIDLFQETYEDHHYWREDMWEQYQIDGYIKLPDGWYMWGDNFNQRSVLNCPVQGTGACILRKAIQLSQDETIDINIPLHDALYGLFDLNDWDSVYNFFECMQNAFQYFFPGKLIGLDGECWSRELQNGEKKLGEYTIKLENIHKDERSMNDYNKFCKYFEAPDSSLL